MFSTGTIPARHAARTRPPAGVAPAALEPVTGGSVTGEPIALRPAPGLPATRLSRAVHWVLRALLVDRPRWPLWLPVGFGAGIGGYFALPAEPALEIVLAAPVPAVLAIWCLREREVTRWVCVLILMVLLGLAVATARTAILDTPMLTRTVWADVEGVVVGIERRPGDVRLTLDAVRLEGRGRAVGPVDRVRVVVRGERALPALGDRVALRARLSPPPLPSVPGGYDFQRAAFFDGLGAVGFAIGTIDIVSVHPRGGVLLAIDRIRAAVTERLTRALPGSAGSVAAALLVGDRAGLDEATSAAFRDSGLAHLLAISGLHMGLVAGTLFAVVRLALCLIPGLALRWPIKKIAAGAALAGSAVYLLLAGAPVPTQRAFGMTGIVLLAVLLDREAVTLRLVALAAFAILAVSPEAVVGPSFQLSFAAVIALVSVYESWRWRAGRGGSERGTTGVGRVVGRGAAYLGGVALTSAIATLATAPFITFHFQSFALGGIVANLVAVPLTAFVTMPAGIVALLAMPVGLERPALEMMGIGLDATLSVATGTVDLVGPAVSVNPLPTSGLVTIVLGGCWVAIWRTRLRWAGIVPMAAGALLWLTVAPPDVLISSDGRLSAVAVDRDHNWVISDARSNRFTRSTWERRWGVADPVTLTAFDKNGTSAAAPLACDDLGCTLWREGRLLSLVTSHEAALEDCGVSDILIATVRLRLACRGTGTVIDRRGLTANGTHAVWLSPAGVRVETVRGSRGERPWTRTSFGDR